LRGFAARILPALILLVPVTLLASELNNIVSAFIPVPDAAPATTVPGEQPAIEGLLALELAVVQVGLAPVLEEFFFRGVLQQGLIASGGAMRGVLGTAFLSAIGHGYLEEQTWLAAMVSAFAAAIVFGYLRLASGSLLASILLSMAISVAGLTAMAFQHEIPIPGFNAPGAHTPIAWLLPATISVALGLLLLGRERARRDTEASLRPTLEPSNDEQS
jgi:membrane protease YdiL (CAAX protease family)